MITVLAYEQMHIYDEKLVEIRMDKEQQVNAQSTSFAEGVEAVSLMSDPDGQVRKKASALEGLPSDEIIYKATRIFSALADSTRFKILTSLASGELCVFDLQELCGVSQSAVSHQLRLLRDIDLVRARREGQHAYYRLSDDHITSMLKFGIDHASE